MVRHVMSVDHDQKAACVVSRQIEAANAYAVVRAVITAVKTADGRERFRQGAVTILADIFGCEDSYAGRGVFQGLGMECGGFDADVEELFQAERSEVLRGNG